MTDNVIETKYGLEVTWADRSNYKSKILIFKNKNLSSPMWINKDSDKDWFINAGKFKVTFIDTASGKVLEQELKEGDVFHCAPMVPAKLTSLIDNSSITEVSSNISEDVILTS